MILLIEDKFQRFRSVVLDWMEFQDNVFSSQLISKITFLLAPPWSIDCRTLTSWSPKDAERHLIVRPWVRKRIDKIVTKHLGNRYGEYSKQANQQLVNLNDVQKVKRLKSAWFICKERKMLQRKKFFSCSRKLFLQMMRSSPQRGNSMTSPRVCAG